ncbi:MAG: NAD(P)H-hydrate epimerase, partial [Bacteroidales bacterium]|nr:NAD(P)H-hydrate epimerase [Bacteroidales bacterium]
MRKILNPQQIHELDQVTAKRQGISSYELMERAVNALFEKISGLNQLDANEYLVVAGTGNNGGDGLGLARKLLEAGKKVTVWFCNFGSRITDECRLNLERFQELDGAVVFLEYTDFNNLYINEESVVIDAIFGIGLNRSVEGKLAKVIDLINASKAKVCAIDIPSGLFCEDNTDNFGAKVMADITLTIQDFHLSAMFSENYKYYGDVFIVDINHDA